MMNMKFYDPALMMLQQALWAFRNWINTLGTKEQFMWEGRFDHMLSEYITFEENEKALRCSAGQSLIRKSDSAIAPNRLKG